MPTLAGMAEEAATAHTPRLTVVGGAHQDGAVHLDGLIVSWERSLRAERKSDKTIKDYLRDTRRFAAGLGELEAHRIERRHVEEFIIAELERTSQSSAASAYRRIQQWFRWLLEEGEVDHSPMEHMSPPKVDEVPVPVIALADIRRLIDACAGREFPERRDHAIIRVLFDTGVRRAECAGIEVDQLDLDGALIRIRGKGGKYRDVPLGAKSVVALDRYLRVRGRHPFAGLKALWLGQRGPMTGDGIRDVVDKRCTLAGVPKLRPHQFRHTLAHRWQVADGNESDLMELMGWSSRDMLGRYGKSAAAERARASHRRLALGDEV